LIVAHTIFANMKYLIALLMVLFVTNTSTAQYYSEKEQKKHIEKVKRSLTKGKNIRSLDTLFASGKPYCIMKATKSGFLEPMAFSLSPLKNSGQEEIFLEMFSIGTGSTTVWFWDMAFVRQGQKIQFQNGTMDLENTVVDYKLFTDSSLNIDGMKKLVLMKGVPRIALPPTPSNPNYSNNPTLVNRDRNGLIQIFGEKVQQSGVQIGIVAETSVAVGGKILNQYTITSNAGELIGIAKNHGVGNNEWELVTSKDNKEHAISSNLGQGKNDVVKYLVEHLYL